MPDIPGRPKRYADACECTCGGRYCAGNRVTVDNPNRMHDDDEYVRRQIAATAKYQQDAQAKSLENADRHFARWAGWELEMLARDDLTLKEIADRLNRTLYAVKTKKRDLNRDPRVQALQGLRRASGPAL